MSADIIEDIEKAIREKGYGEKNAVRIILSGSTDIGFEANIDGILRNCAHLADLIEIKDVSTPLYGAEALEKDITVRGEFYRTMKKKILEGETEEQRSIAAKALKIGLAALDDKNLTSFFPDLNSDKGADA